MAVNLRGVIIPPALGILAVGLLLSGFHLVSAAVPDVHVPASEVQRTQDPVVVSGADFPAFQNVPLDELVLYAYQSGSWGAVPIQIDEVNITGTYVISDDGLLDANDELVFMAVDLGHAAPAGSAPDDPLAQMNPQYVISVTDPLSPSAEGWAYLFRSTTLTRTAQRYLEWNQAAQTIQAISYTAAFTSGFVGLSDLEINASGVDILDRQKVRISAFNGLITFNEETLAGLITPTITLPVVGPVRALNGEGELKVAFYGGRLDIDVTFDTSPLPVPPDFIRTSLDLNDPSVTGVTWYYDSNTQMGVPVDGVPDVVSATPRVDWYQVNGAMSGPGGLVVTYPILETAGGEATNYYKDDATIDPNDTGDERSYGDSGLKITEPGQVIQLQLVAFILPPGTSDNLGAEFYSRVNNPLEAAARERHAAPPSPAQTLLPLIINLTAPQGD